MKVDLGARVSLTNPLMLDGSSQVGVTGQVGLRVRDDLRLDASYGRSGGSEQFKVSLTWRS
ncbi:MAG: hypothetical protein M9894_36320 [Planctomycetes bacterium]|nr:hypothetical protein [Planctomycetota bacterium]